MQGYREMIFEGSLPIVKAFLAGLRLGRAWVAEYYFSEECSISAESKGQRIFEKLGLRTDVTHVLVAERLAGAVATGVRATRAETGIVLRLERRVRSASFGYHFAVYNRNTATRIRKLLARMPEDLTLEDAEQSEDLHPGARGAEGYAPEHEYVFSGKGRVKGPFEHVLAFHQILGASKWVTRDMISLTTGR
jgi:hypothetical protein